MPSCSCPFSTFESFYGRRKTTVVSVKMASSEAIEPAMARAEEAMRIAHRLRPGEPNDFTVDKADALVAFLAAAHPGVVHRDPRRGLYRDRGRRHRHHEHHAHERD